VSSGNYYGAGYTTNTVSGVSASFTGSPTSGVTYDDPYLGGRAPEYVNWSIGFQRQVTNALAVTATYVGSEGHFLQLDSYNGRGIQADQLDPKYLYLAAKLNDKGAAVATDCNTSTNNLTCNAVSLAQFANASVNQALSTYLKPNPFVSYNDSFGYIGNANYHGVQLMANMRAWHGLTFNANYSYSRAIDDAGTFRSGYAIPAGTIANHPTESFPADLMERSVSTSNQPQHFVLTSVYALPFGKSILNTQPVERAILGGFKLSGIYQAYSGSPLALTASTCQTNPAAITCEPTLNPNFSGSARQPGKWGKGVNYNTYTSTSFIVPSVGSTTVAPTGPFISPTVPSGQTTLLNTATVPAYTFGDSPRTAPYGLYGPGNYQLDLALVRSFPLHITEASKLNFRAEWYNVTNHTLFGVASTQLGNANFGQVTQSSIANRKAAQFSARIEF
jgi:hypothetical protein